MTSRIEKPVFHKDEYREQTDEEVIETLRIALQEAKDRLTPVTLIQEVRKCIDGAYLEKAKKQVSDLRKGKYA